MNPTLFKKGLESISIPQWQQVVDGAALRLVDDEVLEVGVLNAPDAIIAADPDDPLSAEALRQASMEDADDILTNFYRIHPLTEKGFNQQVMVLIQQHGATGFGAEEGRKPGFTLFVDGGEVIAEARGNPRHPYGAGCVLSRFSTLSPEEQVMRWVESGKAYERYMSMNVCRYNC